MTPKRCFFPRMGLYSQASSKHRVNPKGVKLSGKTDDDIEDLYRIAMEEDEEWYNDFMKNVMGEEDQSISAKKDSFQSAQIGKDEKNEKNEPFKATENEKKTKNEKNEPFKSSQNDVILEKKRPKDTGAAERKGLNIESDRSEKRGVSVRRENRDKAGDQNGNITDERVFVQYVGIDGYNTRKDIQDVTSLGYSKAEISMLRADALDLILEDEIPIPKSGVPTQWTVRDRREREVKIVKRKTTNSPVSQSRGESAIRDRQNMSEKNRDPNRRSRSRDRKSNKSRVRSSSSKRNRQNNIEPSASVWMDVETFKRKLRKEAELRLLILGPDWEEWVKGESDWRLNLYKKWLLIVEEGIGDDPFEDISYAPREVTSSSPVRRSKARRTPNSRGVKSERSRRYDTENEYKRYAKRTPATTRRDRIGNSDSISRRPPRSRENRLQRRSMPEGQTDDIYSDSTSSSLENRRGRSTRRNLNRIDSPDDNRISSQRRMKRQKTRSEGRADFDQPRANEDRSNRSERTNRRNPGETDGTGKRNIEILSVQEEICNESDIERE